MIRPIRCLALLALLLVAAPSFAATARELYAAAVAREKALHEQGVQAGTLKQYRAAVNAFEAVVRRYPTSGYADNALWEASRLAREAHDRFGDERESATATRLLTWLVEEYPTSRLTARARAELKRGEIPLKGEPTAAAKIPLKGDPTPAAKIPLKGDPSAAAKIPPKGDPTPVAPTPVAAATNAAGTAGATVLRDVRRTIVGDTVRITIQLDAEVVFRSERVENPPRVLFDLAATRLGPAVAEGTQTYSGDMVRHVRIGRHPNQMTRVVVDLEGVKRYSVFTLYSPYRIVIDCERDRGTSPPAAPARTAPVPERIEEERLKPPPPEPEPDPDPLPLRLLRPAASMGAPRVVAPLAAPSVAPATTPRPVSAPGRRPAVRPLRPARSFAPTRRLVALLPTVQQLPAPVFPAPVTPAEPRPVAAPPAPLAPAADKAAAEAAPEKRAVTPAASEKPERTEKPDKPEKAVTPAVPPPAPPNGFSLARQLGLGASRIVIDPGHGGHDPGAEGGGTYESEVVLDVALRLEKLLRAAGIDVVLTRRTDQYVPLEERTAIANRSQGDLFLSIHANASRNRSARGVETYFLNFATNPDAEAVAARENAATGRTMSNLPEIVKAITLNNKLDESKSLAALVQGQMVEHLKGSNKGLKNHGVKQAPFVVLIGASMPSVLVEVSFITNGQEGRLLKNGPYRQKIADALFDAVRGYQKSLKGTATLTSQH